MSSNDPRCRITLQLGRIATVKRKTPSLHARDLLEEKRREIKAYDKVAGSNLSGNEKTFECIHTSVFQVSRVHTPEVITM